MFRNLSDFISVVVLSLSCIVAFRLFVFSLVYKPDIKPDKESIFELFSNYNDNEDE